MRIEHDVRYTHIYPFDGQTTAITISRPAKDFSEDWLPAKVNFPTFGEQDAKTIAQYAQALLVAARLCADFNSELWPDEAQWEWDGKKKAKEGNE